MSVLDNVIKMRELEQQQNDQMVNSLLKGITLAQQSQQLQQEQQKTNVLTEIQKKTTQAELAKSGLQWNAEGTQVEALPSDIIESMGNMKDALMSPTDRLMKETLLSNRQADLKKKEDEAQHTEMIQNLTPLPEGAPEEDKQTWLSQLDPKDAALIKSITNYNYDVWRGLSFRDRERVGSLAALYDPTFSMAEFEIRKDYKTEFTKGKIGANIRSYNTVLGHLSSLMDAVRNPELPSNPVRVVEKMQRGVSKQFAGSSPEVKAMASEDNAITAVSGELATVFKNSGGTDQEIEKWFESYDRDATKQYKEEWVKKGLELVSSRMDAIAYDYERVLKRPVPSDQKIISPKAQAAIGRITGKKETSEGIREKYNKLRASGMSKEEAKKALGL